MHVFLTGGTGYIGSHLVRHFRAAGHDCTVVTRGGTPPWDDTGIRLLEADPKRPGAWQAEAARADVIVNLAGAPLVDPPHRWTAAAKRMIRASRVDTTERLAEAIAAADRPPGHLISQSAVGYYGNRGEAELPESAAPGDDFVARICRDWEGAAMDVADRCRVTLLRTAPVVGRGAPLLKPMLPPFKLGLGGPWGSGKQWWPWIHVDDVVGMVQLVIDRALTGPVNLVAPEPVRVETFAKALGQALGRPAIARVPEFALRVALGEAADAILVSQRVVPARVRDAAYDYRYPTLPDALAASV